MQRMLVGLLVFLTAVVGVLAVMLFQLQDRVDAKQARTAAPAPATETEGADATRVARLERRVSGLLAQLDDLKEQHRATVRALAKGSREANKEGSDDAPLIKLEDGLRNAARRADGIHVSERDEAFYLAVKRSVDRKQRIQNTFDQTMRRLDRFAVNGAIQPIEGEHRKKVGEAILKYVTATDDMLVRYFRNPSERVKALPVDQRREAVKAERDEILTQAENDLAAAIGAEDAQAVADKMLKSVRRIRPDGGNGRRRRGR